MEGVMELYRFVALYVFTGFIGAYLFYRIFKRQVVLETQLACLSFNLELLRAAFDHISNLERAPLDVEEWNRNAVEPEINLASINPPRIKTLCRLLTSRFHDIIRSNL